MWKNDDNNDEIMGIERHKDEHENASEQCLVVDPDEIIVDIMHRKWTKNVRRTTRLTDTVTIDDHFQKKGYNRGRIKASCWYFLLSHILTILGE